MISTLYLICIDPGHGGIDSGALINSVAESRITLEIALKLNEILSYWDRFETILTRSKDEYLSLPQRVSIANDAEASIFLSIHINSFFKPDVDGIETYYSESNPASKPFADITQKNLIYNTDYKDRKVKTADYYVIKHTRMPSILVELGFLSNRQTREDLQTDSVQFIMAFSLAQSIKDYFIKGGE